MPANKEKKEIRKREIVTSRLQGKSYREIGKEVGLSYTQVGNILNEEDCQTEIKSGIYEYIGWFPKVRAKFKELVLHKDPHISGKNIEQYHKVLALNAPQASLIIQQIYQDNRTQIISPEIQKLINKQCEEAIEGEIIEEKKSNSE